MPRQVTSLISPMKRIPPDVLWYIIEINADMFDYQNDDALTTTRRTSQVCRHWRNLTLGRPSLWGKLIDIQYLSERKFLWMNEVLRRSESSLLWIKSGGMIQAKNDDPTSDFFFNILARHWERIQRLEVYVCIKDTSDKMWFALCRPAPHLETLSLHLMTENGGPTTHEALFSGSAPMLRNFHPRPCRFDLKAPWLRNLRSLRIGAKLTTYEVLTALSNTPNLVSLEVDSWVVMGDETARLPLISLPKLNHVDVYSDFKIGGKLLRHLVTPPGCSFEYTPNYIMRDPLFNVSEEEFCSLAHTLSKFARRYFQSRFPTNISLYHSYNLLEYTCRERTNPAFKIWLRRRIDEEFPEYVHAALLRAFALPALSHVTELRLELHDSQENIPIDVFISFLACLSAVKVLHANDGALSWLLAVRRKLKKVKNAPKVILPALKIIKLDCEMVEPATSAYILNRVKDGYPIDVLDFSDCEAESVPDVSALEEATGLKILWRRNRMAGVWEYVCGRESVYH